MKTKTVKWLFWVLLVLILAIIVREFNYYRGLTTTNHFLEHFNAIPQINTFSETLPQVYGGEHKRSHAVLLLHGYSSSPHEFYLLTPALQKVDIPYYAPQLLGFGLGDMHLLFDVEASDWLREALNAYDVLAAFFDEISIVGHSNGAALAVFIAMHRKVKHLILTGPNLQVGRFEKIYKKILNTPVLSSLFTFTLPVFEKPKRPGRITNSDTCDPKEAIKAFHYPALPIQSLLAIWKVQDVIDIEKAHFQTLNILYGKFDQSVDNLWLVDKLQKSNIPFNIKNYPFSCHNVYVDYDSKKAIEETVEILKQP